MTGAPTGVPVTTVKPMSLLRALVLPAASVASAFTVCAPSVSAVATLHAHTPAAFAVAVHAAVLAPSTYTATVEPASAVPLMTGVALVVSPETGRVMTGAPGGVVSTLKCTGCEGIEVCPETVAVAVTVCAPSASVVETSHEKRPSAAAVAVHSGVLEPSAYTRTVLFGAATPEMVGFESAVCAPSAGAVMTGGPDGTSAETVK
jgi:hypothetical protein